jgi:Flp pilus assembly protein TadG
MYPLRNHAESGQGALELALSLPVFLILILATVEIANIAWASVQVKNAAHAAVQFGSQSHANASTSAANILNIEQAAKNDVPASLASKMTFPTAPAQSCACVDSTGNATASDCSTINTTNCAAPDVIADTLQVTVQAVITPIVHYPGLPATYTLQSTANSPVINK